MNQFVVFLGSLLLVAGSTSACSLEEIENCSVNVYHVFHHPEDFPTTVDTLKTRCDLGSAGLTCMADVAKRCPKYEKALNFFVDNTRIAAARTCAADASKGEPPILAFGKCINVDKTKEYTCGNSLTAGVEAAKLLDTPDKQKRGACCAFRKMKSCIKDHVLSTCSNEAALQAGREFFDGFMGPAITKCQPFGLTDEACEKLFEGVTLTAHKKKIATGNVIDIFSQA